MRLKHTRLEDVIWSPFNGQATWNQTRLEVLDNILTEVLAIYPRMYTGSYYKLIWPIIVNVNHATNQPRRFVEDDLKSMEYLYDI